MAELEKEVIQKLKGSQQILCTVESCTGGLVSHLLTNVSGASEVIWGAFVTYDNFAKRDLGVKLDSLQKFGAVSKEVALELAEGGLRKLERSLSSESSQSLVSPKGFVCVATTGIAGPGGGTPAKPVGLCFIALARSGRAPVVIKFQSTRSDRIKVKEDFAHRALQIIQENL